MAHELLRLKSSLKNTPLLATTDLFENVLEYINNRNVTADLGGAPQGVSSPLKVENGIGYLHIVGVLSDKPTKLSALCGATTYRQLVQDATLLFNDTSVQQVVMVVDSGGGEAGNMLNTASQLRELADTTGKPLTAFVDGMSASAAYGLSVAASNIIATPSSSIGSVGVLVALQDTSKKDEQEGVKNIYITSGASKVPFAEDGSFKESFLADIKGGVMELYDDFTSHVATFRGIEQEAVKGTEAKVFNAKKAMDVGFVDELVNPQDLEEWLLNKNGKLNNNVNQAKAPKGVPAKADGVNKPLTAKQASIEAYKAKLLARDTKPTTQAPEEVVTPLSREEQLKQKVESKKQLTEAEQAKLDLKARVKAQLNK